jgi:hypothetical protein
VAGAGAQAAAKIMTTLTMPSPEGISSPLGPALADAFKGRFSAKTSDSSPALAGPASALYRRR